MTLTLKQQLAAAATLSVAAVGAQANCTGGNSAGCSTAANQSGNAVAQANAEGGQGGNASNKNYALPSLVPGAPYACPTWTFGGVLVTHTRTEQDCLDKLAKSAELAKACEIAQGNTTESLRLRTQLAAAKVPETAELALRRDIGHLGRMGAQGLLQFCPGTAESDKAATTAENKCKKEGKVASLFGDECDPIVPAAPVVVEDKATKDRLAAVEAERNRLQAELDKCSTKQDNSAAITAALATIEMKKLCVGKGYSLKSFKAAAAENSCPVTTWTCVGPNGQKATPQVGIVPEATVKKLREYGVTF